jgi:rhodanese-related sulfurtransferase
MSGILEKYGFEIQKIRHVTPREALELCEKGALLLDVRLNVLFINKRFDVPESFHCVYDEIKEYYHHLPQDKPIIVADAVGIRSKEVVEFLKENGFSQLANLAGGIHDWETDGLPMIIDQDETLTGGCMCQIRTWGKNRKKKIVNE